MKVGILGTGHVGLITCVTLASVGHDVVGVDADPEKTEALQRGVAPFFEPGLSELLAETLGEHVFDFFLRNKRAEWEEYRTQVSAFERDRMLPVL